MAEPRLHQLLANEVVVEGAPKPPLPVPPSAFDKCLATRMPPPFVEIHTGTITGNPQIDLMIVPNRESVGQKPNGAARGLHIVL